MKAKAQVLATVLLCVIVSTIAPSTAPGQSSKVTIITVSLPERATLLGFSMVKTTSSSASHGWDFTLIFPKESDALVMQIGGRGVLCILSPDRGFPVRTEVAGALSLMGALTADAVPVPIGLNITAGLCFSRFFSLGSTIRVAPSVTPFFVLDMDTAGSRVQGLLSVGIKLVIGNLVSLSPGITFGKNLWNPGISLVIGNSVSLRVDIAYIDGETIPTFSAGLIGK